MGERPVNDDAVIVEREPGEDRHETVAAPTPERPAPRVRYDTHRAGNVWFGVGVLVALLLLSKITAGVLG